MEVPWAKLHNATETRPMHRLITIPISHFCEKARWALDVAGIRFAEEPHLQLFHRFAARRAGGGVTVPVLVTPGGAIGESAAIVAYADARSAPDRRLLPEDPAERALVLGWQARHDAVLGPEGRRLMYTLLLPHRAIAMRYGQDGVPRLERALFPVAYPLAARLIARALDARPGTEVASEAAVRASFDEVAAALADGRPYLCGERFTAADLTFAALAASVLMPARYGVALPPPELLPGRLGSIVSALREHPAGRHALAMYERHR